MDSTPAALSKKESSPRLHTRVCDLLGIQYPVLQAGMGLVTYGRIAGAVSEAGGLGVIGAAYLSPERLEEEIRVVRSMTDKPFGVDILFAEPASTGKSASDYSKETKEHIRTALDNRVPVIISGLGNPAAILDEAHDRGIKVLSVVGNVKQAERLAGAGVDAVIACGHEGGGHTGRVATFVIVPYAVDRLKIPVVAAGGIVDGRGLAAALALGAEGVWVGTRFITTCEAEVHINYKEKIIRIDDEGTVVTRCHSGKTCRLIKNKFTEKWERQADRILPFPLQMQQVGMPASELGRKQGDVENGSCPAGQGSANIYEIKSAKEVVLEMVNDASAVLNSLSTRYGQ